MINAFLWCWFDSTSLSSAISEIGKKLTESSLICFFTVSLSLSRPFLFEWIPLPRMPWTNFGIFRFGLLRTLFDVYLFTLLLMLPLLLLRQRRRLLFLVLQLLLSGAATFMLQLVGQRMGGRGELIEWHVCLSTAIKCCKIHETIEHNIRRWFHNNRMPLHCQRRKTARGNSSVNAFSTPFCYFRQ